MTPFSNCRMFILCSSSWILCRAIKSPQSTEAQSMMLLDILPQVLKKQPSCQRRNPDFSRA